jgi:hypothetical protein
MLARASLEPFQVSVVILSAEAPSRFRISRVMVCMSASHCVTIADQR